MQKPTQAKNAFDGLVRRTSAALNQLADHVGSAVPAKRIFWEADFSDLTGRDKDEFRTELASRFPAKCPTLYSIALGSSVDCELAWHLLNVAKSEKRLARAYCRVPPFANSHIMYVGSSQKLPHRILEHLGFGSKSTYALNLAHWASELVGTFTVDAQVYDEVTPEVLCALEDQLAVEVRPLFGRRGSLGVNAGGRCR